MTWQWKKSATPDDSVNLLPATGAWAIYYLVQTLIQAGWTAQSWSDGATLNVAGGLTSGGAGANGWANAYAWVRLRSPAGAGGVELAIQRGTGNQSWRLKVSPSLGFVLTAGDATTAPTATDQQHVVGTDVPAFGTMFGADDAYALHCGADAAAPYSFYLFSITHGATVPTSRLIFGGLVEGTCSVDDDYPWVLGWCLDPASAAYLYSSVYGVGWGFSGAAWVRWPAGFEYVDGVIANGSIPTNPSDGHDDQDPVSLKRLTSSGNGGKKGVVKDFGIRLVAGRAFPDYLDIADAAPADRRAYMGDLVVPWPATVLPVT